MGDSGADIGVIGDGGNSLTQIEWEWKCEWLMGDSGPRTESTLSFLRSNGVSSFMGAFMIGVALGVASIPTIEVVDLVLSAGKARSLNNRGCESDWGPP